MVVVSTGVGEGMGSLEKGVKGVEMGWQWVRRRGLGLLESGPFHSCRPSFGGGCHGA